MRKWQFCGSAKKYRCQKKPPRKEVCSRPSKSYSLQSQNFRYFFFLTPELSELRKKWVFIGRTNNYLCDAPVAHLWDVPAI